MNPLRITCRLAVRDWMSERLLSLCAVLTLASVLAPLLVLFGIRFGLVATMQQRLLEDPAILTISSVGSGSYTADWLATIKRRPEVTFATLTTRSIAATMQLSKDSPEASDQRVTVSVEPTGLGDPLLACNAIDFRGMSDESGRDPVVISALVAAKLKAQTGDILVGQIGRKRPDGVLESASLRLRVAGVLPLAAQDKEVVYTSLALLDDLENYRDYIVVGQRNFLGDPPPPGQRFYSGFRIGVKELESVGNLRDYLQNSLGIETYTRARDIAVVQNLDNSLRIVFWLVALAAGTGFMAATAGAVLAGVRRKDKHLGMLRLMGLPGVALFPVVQALLTGFMGTLCAGGLYLFFSTVINILFADALNGLAVCRLPIPYFLGSLVLVLTLSAVASIGAARAAARIEPSDVLRAL